MVGRSDNTKLECSKLESGGADWLELCRKQSHTMLETCCVHMCSLNARKVPKDSCAASSRCTEEKWELVKPRTNACLYDMMSFEN